MAYYNRFRKRNYYRKKRNAYLVGLNQDIIAFKFVRKITIDEHLFGADIHIKVVGGTISAFCLSKSDANTIKEMLLEFNSTKNGRGIIFS